MEKVYLNLSSERNEKICNIAVTATVASLILLGTYNHYFSLAALLVMAGAVLSWREQKALALMAFVLPMAQIFKFSPKSTSFFTYIELLFVLLYVLKEHWKLNRNEFLAFSFVGYLCLSECIAGQPYFLGTIKLVCNIFCLL